MDTSQLNAEGFSSKELNDWLHESPPEWVQAITVRSSLRVLPLLQFLPTGRAHNFKRLIDLPITVFRANFISWVACKFQTLNLNATAKAAANAANAANAAADAAKNVDNVFSHATEIAGDVANAAADAANAAVDYANAVAYASNVIAYTSSAANGAAAPGSLSSPIQFNVTKDILLLESMREQENAAVELLSDALWFDNREGILEIRWQSLKDTLENDDHNWAPWINWYEAVLEGRPVYDHLTPDQEKSLLVEWASIDPKDWNEGAAHVNQLIRDIEKANFAKAQQPHAKKKKGKTARKTPSTPAPEPPLLSSHVSIQDDSVDSTVDYLGRSEIALALAGRLNEVWDTKNRDPGTLPCSQYLFNLVIWWKRLFGVSDQGDLKPGYVVHLDAPWGGGKTSFAGFVSRILNPWRIKGDQPDWLKKLDLADERTWKKEFRRPWHIVKFNAWQHQHVNPPWWTFYQTIRKQCLAAMRDESNHRDAAELPPPVERYKYRWVAGRWIQWGWCSVSEILWRLATPKFVLSLGVSVASIVALYVSVSNGWISTSDGKAASGATNGTWLSTILILLLGGAAPLLTLFTGLTATLLPGTPDAANNYSAGAGDPLERFRKHFARVIERFGRPVLVIVDDLDRCKPEFVVELVRGMQTILVSPRVVFILLGDRDWIEKSFAEAHKAMKGINVGAEHEFGARFVEKAIQFSFVLPDIDEADRRNYVRALLKIKDNGKGQNAEQHDKDSAIQNIEIKMEKIVGMDDFQTREEAADDLFKSEDYVSLPDEQRQQLDVENARKLARRAVSDTTVDRGTGHMIEALALILPPNPRQIKRIINSLSLLQQTMRLDDPSRRPGSLDWQILVRWVVLMTEWPKTWYTLTAYPELIEMVYDGRKSKGINLPPDVAIMLAKKIRDEDTVMNILNFNDIDKGWPEQRIDSTAVRWLKQLMPATSGEALTVEVKKDKDKKS